MLTDKDNDQINVEVLTTVDGKAYYWLKYKSIVWLEYPLDAVGISIGEAVSKLYRRKHELKKLKKHKLKAKVLEAKEKCQKS